MVGYGSSFFTFKTIYLYLQIIIVTPGVLYLYNHPKDPYLPYTNIDRF